MEELVELKDVMLDKKSSCLSYMVHIKLSEYLKLIKPVYEDNGGMPGQRSVLTSKSALKIREQMINDFSAGAILPAVVLGVVDSKININEHMEKSEQDGVFFGNYLKSMSQKLCIIDGMQRTTAMQEAQRLNHIDPVIRVEIWLSNSINQLIYRMLVLNTGQVPWTVRRQLEVLMSPIVQYLKDEIYDAEILSADDKSRRSKAGVFQADKILEAFLIFGTRSEKVSSKDAVSDEYIRLDFIESSSKNETLSLFSEYLKRIVRFDKVLSKVDEAPEQRRRFSKGLDLFTSQPVLAGCTAAFAQKILGRPKVDYPKSKQDSNMERIMSDFDMFLSRMEAMSPDELQEFCSLDSLNEYIPASTSSKVGDLERGYFKDAFSVLIDERFSVETLDVCWGN